ncbi:tail fiber protein [Escherichia phage vB_Eco_mar004NP2]|uniref:Tail fiber protein n=1 Tax=Escherichia phage vB_Eco_mar004NP2 TaxID=2419762 RepID=A0A3P4A849_9CAUD|nr:tail fiber protein [Escherichia phage vB_Eco_mar004NP2]VCU43556.1 tail fiber protein [Escherichia phage vB_Eco_mar004NP2]
MVTKTVIPTDITKLKNESLNKNNNLSDLADRAAAWLNVRPIGSTPLAGDPVSDYDAATKRWVENKLNTGTVGPTMNGVMNYGVGDFHLRDSRAYIQPYEVVSDGQLLNRADWPELWAYAQMVGAIDDSVWLADVGQRGKYSTGDGTTTFRVPDRNGVQLNSIKGLFARGDGGGDAGQAGSISEAAAPNITGSFPGAIAGAYEEALNRYSSRFGLIGAIGGENGLGAAPGGASKSFAVVNPDNQYGFSFDANLADPVYGRYGIKGTIIPNSFIGVWVIRASGGFVAAKTSWSVISGDAVKPNTGTTVYGGSVLSEYKVGTSSEAVSTLRAKATIGGTYSTELLIDNKSTGKSNSAQLVDNGDFVTDRFKARLVTGMAWSQTGWVQGTLSQNEVNIGSTFNFNSILSGSQSSSAGYKTSAHFGLIHNDLGSFADSCWQVAGDDDNKFGVRLKIQPNNNSIYFYSWWPGASATYTLQLNAVSDSRLKHDIKAIDATKSIEVLKGLEFQSFVYNNDEKSRVRRGVIAQQVETIEPLYVKTRKFYNDDGIEQEQKELDTTPMLLDTMHVVQDLIKRIEDLEKELEQLKVQLVSQ